MIVPTKLIAAVVGTALLLSDSVFADDSPYQSFDEMCADNITPPDWLVGDRNAEHSCTCDVANGDEALLTCQSDEAFCCLENGRCHTEHVEWRSRIVQMENPYIEEYYSDQYCPTFYGNDVPNRKVDLCMEWQYCIPEGKVELQSCSCEIRINGVPCQKCEVDQADPTKSHWDCTNTQAVKDGLPEDILKATATSSSPWSWEVCPGDFVARELSALTQSGGSALVRSSFWFAICTVLGAFVSLW